MVARRCEYTAAMLWALATAAAASALILTVSFGGVGAWLCVPAFLWLGRHGRIGRAQHGALIGLAAFPATIALMHLGHQPCPASAADMADGTWSCGGTDPLPYLIATALVLAAFALVWRLAKPKAVSHS